MLKNVSIIKTEQPKEGNDMTDPQERNSRYIAELLKTGDVFEQEQVDALCGTAPMTQKIFEEVLELCHVLQDVEGFLAVWDSFPEFAGNYTEQTTTRTIIYFN